MEPLLGRDPNHVELGGNYIITDFMTNINQVSSLGSYQEKLTGWGKMLRGFSILNPSVWVVLILLGLLSALVGFSIDYVSDRLLEARIAFADTGSVHTDFIVWMLYSLVFAWISAACGRWISQDAEGSGIPEMKSILSGINIYRYLSFQTLTAKVIGLTSAFGAGLSIGREGPFVHIAGIIANKLLKAKCFSHIYKVRFTQNETLRYQILGASVAAGVAATFGAPIGGVLFSIEVTATYYVVNNLWKGFFCAVWCCLLFMILNLGDVSNLLNNVVFEPFEFGHNAWLYALLGLLCGVLGAGLVRLIRTAVVMRRTRQFGQFSQRFHYTMLVAAVCAVITFQAPYLRMDDHRVMKHFFQDRTPESVWDDDKTGLNVFIYFIAKCVMTSISYSCPIPCGIFTPIFVAGSAFGRFYGYLVKITVGTRHMGVYAVVGAAALTSSVTHTLSVAVIVFELTGDMHYMMVMLIAVVMSYAVGTALSPSIYDALMDMKSLPFLPTLRPSRIYRQRAKHVMNTDFFSLRQDSTLAVIAERLESGVRDLQRIPILGDSAKLVADVSLADLRKYLVGKYFDTRQSLPGDLRGRLDVYFERLLHLSSQTYVLITQLQLLPAGPLPRQSTKQRVGEASQFWALPIDWQSPHLELDDSPLSISEGTPLAKVHFMFMMLGLSQLYVIRDGTLVGCITRDSFSHKLR